MSRSLHQSRAGASLALGLLAGLVGGCASEPTPVAQQAENQSDATTVAMSEASEPSAVVRRLTNIDNGLELRRWTIPNDHARLVEALHRHGAEPALIEGDRARLQRNGLRLVRLPIEHLHGLISDLGGANVDRNEWHGQIPEWRSIVERPIERDGRALAVDGRVRRFDRGEMRLLIRSWTVQMEHGPLVHLEVVPRHHLPRANDLRKLLGEGGPTGEAYPSMAIDMQLESGWGYVLLGESPQAVWPGAVAESGAPPAPSSARRQRMGPDDAVGPEDEAPLTLGEFLLAARPGVPVRSIMVFVPRVPPELFIPSENAGEQLASTPSEPDA